MYKHILVPTDGSEISAKAVQTAIALAKLTGATLTTISVKEPFPYSAISEMQPVPPQEFYDAQERIAAASVKTAIDATVAADVKCTGYTVADTGAQSAIDTLRTAFRSVRATRPFTVDAIVILPDHLHCIGPCRPTMPISPPAGA